MKPSTTDHDQMIDFAVLSPIERITLADVLYDSAMQEIKSSPISTEELAELDRRIADVDAGRVEMFTWDQVRDELLARQP